MLLKWVNEKEIIKGYKIKLVYASSSRAVTSSYVYSLIFCIVFASTDYDFSTLCPADVANHPKWSPLASVSKSIPKSSMAPKPNFRVQRLLKAAKLAFFIKSGNPGHQS